MKLQLYVVALALGLVSQTVFGALVITEVAPNPGAPASSILENLDWFEITNTGPSAASLDGFEWIDNPSDDEQSAIFPNGISVASGESIIIHRNSTSTTTFPGVDVANAFRADWGLSPSVQILTEDQFTGNNPFSGLGSGGDAVFLYDGPTPTLPPAPPGTGTLVSVAPFGISSPGISFEWGTNGTGVGQPSILGQNGAYGASNGRVGSPGFATTITNSDPTIFKDTFELASFISQPDVNAELPGPRQTGLSSLYTPGWTPAAAGVLIEDDPFGPGSGDWLTLRTAGPVASANDFSIAQANLNTNFGPLLVGNKYSISYTSRIDEVMGMDPNVGAWQALNFGDTAPTFINDPAGNVDLGLLLNPTGGWQAFLDGELVADNGTTDIDTGIRLGQFFDVQIVIDETGSSPTATATITATLGPVVLGTLPLDAGQSGSGFDSASRFFQLQTFLDAYNGGFNDGALDHRFDNFTIAEVASLIADFNNDGAVDGTDLQIWQTGYGTGVSLAEGDADGDGDVDGRDFLLWQRNVTASPLAASTAVPEPASCALAMLALTVGVGLWRKPWGLVVASQPAV